ncbi:MAG: protein translocase subunit SecD [Rhizobiales bacterium]|nr:protein translocase subunit SecD [Hyphomicrobiales bacterium]
MLQFNKWKAFSIIAIIIAGIVMALPNVLPDNVRKGMPAFLPSSPMTLGLDLRGGAHMVLEIDQQSLRKILVTQLRGDVRQVLFTDNKIKHKISRGSGGEIIAVISDPGEVEKAGEELRRLARPVNTGFFGQGADVPEIDIDQSGNRFTLKFSDQGFTDRIRRTVEQAISVLGNRLNPDGTLELTIQRQGDDRVLVQVPGVDDAEIARLKGLIDKPGFLQFRLLCDDQPSQVGQRAPLGCEAIPTRENAEFVNWVQTSRRATVDGSLLNDARPGFDQRNGEPIVSFTFNQKGALQFGKLTQANVNKRFGIILDGVVVSAPSINEPILGGSGQISGNFSVEEANDLSIVLRSGALPAKLIIVQESLVGPSLGSDSIKAGFIACVLGLAAVLVFMVISYGLFGLFANLALVVNLMLLIGLLSILQATLTLPGIAGIVLTMGMAVDSNVLVFERVREEVRNGRSPLNAIETGFARALSTILDANITTLIAAVILFGMGSGPIRGFAVTLGFGIVTTVFTAFTLTRLVVAWWIRRYRPKTVPI